jgi:hypothetical protein
MRFFFDKKNMTEIIQTASKNALQPVSTEGLTPKQIEIEENNLKQQEKLRNEINDKDESMNRELEELNKEEQQKLAALSSVSSQDMYCRTIEQIEGLPLKNVVYKPEKNEYQVKDKFYKTFDEYEIFKRSENENITAKIIEKIDEMISLEKIKYIFEPNADFTKIGNNIEKVENGLYSDQFCQVDIHTNKGPFFSKNRSTQLTWDSPTEAPSYKQQIIVLFETIQKNILFADLSPLIDKVIKRILLIENITINYSKELWEESDKNLCKLLPQIKKTFKEIEPILKEIKTKLAEYPDKANEKMRDIKIENNRKNAELSEKNKDQITKIKEYYTEKRNGIKQKLTGGESNPLDEIKQNEIAEKNIMLMIRLMFPTKYPIIGNIFSSFHSVVTGKNEFHLKFTDFIPGFLKKRLFEGVNDFSYIKVDSKVFTVIQAIWLNDIYNHKEYKKLVEQYEELQKWKDREANKSEREVRKKREQFTQTLHNPEYKFTDNDIDNISDTLKSIDSVKGRTAEYTLTKYKITVEELIKSMKKIKTNNGKIIENSKNFADLFLELQRTQWFNPKDKNRYEKIALKMRDEIEKITGDEHILKNYLQSPGINLDYLKDKYRSILENKYGVYVRFVENIRKYRAPILESSNYLLQGSIDDFLNGTEKYKGVFNFLMNPLNIKKNPYQEMLLKNSGLIFGKELEDVEKEQSQYENRLNTGVTLRPRAQGNEAYYEIYVQLNLIGGEINDTNKSSVDCMFQGESLTDKLSRLLNEAIYNPWTLNSSRIFFDITQEQPKEASEKTVSKDSLIENSEISQKEIEGGGHKGKSMRKYRELFMRARTRRKYI